MKNSRQRLPNALQPEHDRHDADGKLHQRQNAILFRRQMARVKRNHQQPEHAPRDVAGEIQAGIAQQARHGSSHQPSVISAQSVSRIPLRCVAGYT